MKLYYYLDVLNSGRLTWAEFGLAICLGVAGGILLTCLLDKLFKWVTK